MLSGMSVEIKSGAMKKFSKITLIAALSLFVVAVAFKGWFLYQQRHVCEPKIRSAVQKFVEGIQAKGYETLDDKSMFIDKRHFQDVKAKISKSYSLKIKDWGADFGAYVILEFNNGVTYALMLVPLDTSLISCRTAEYRILTIR